MKMKSDRVTSYTAIGVMSGTSLDGLDLALCRFYKENSSWSYEITGTRALSYSGTHWPERLTGAETAGGFELMELHRDFGRYTGESINKFLKDTGAEKPDLIASHGHTIFHRPEKCITLQIGDGASIAAVAGITTVSDFRRLDVALGGQGAPLVPIGDKLLFGNYTYCLNLGGFANISFDENGVRKAFDICPANIVLNRLSAMMGKEYDRGGDTGRTGIVVPELLRDLENLEYYMFTGPRSLGKEWVDDVFYPVIDKSAAPVEHKLRTVYEHIALQIAGAMEAPPAHPEIINEKTTPYSKYEEFIHPGSVEPPSLFITGGGARNTFLTELISSRAAPVYTVIPEESLLDFKEALVFAFLGVLRLRNEINCLSSVTGAGTDNSGGIIHLV